MSNIVIVGNSNLKHISLISLYTKYFDEHNIPYDLIYIDRYNIEEVTSAVHQYRYVSQPMKCKFQKILTFLKFRRYAIEVINKNQYEVVICWQTTMFYIMADYLLRNYRNKYVVNIRDYIMEKNPIIRILLKPMVKNAAFITISSNGFREFLPKHEYVVVNSINEEIIENESIVKHKQKRKDEPIKIGFVGNCRFFEENYRLIDAFANDARFELWYCGTNSELLQKYADERGIMNVMTIPSFEREETMEIIRKFDIINSAFGQQTLSVKSLIPIRLYTAISECIPVMASKNTQLAREIEGAQIGVIIDEYRSAPDVLYQYMNNLDRARFEVNCHSYIKKARTENILFYESLANLIANIKISERGEL